MASSGAVVQLLCCVAFAGVSMAQSFSAWSFPAGFGGSVSTGGSGAEYASRCNAAHISWSSASAAYTNPNPVYATVITTFVETVTIRASATPLLTQSFATQCDGLDRPPSVEAQPSFFFSSMTTVGLRTTDLSNNSFVEPSPACRVNANDCAGLSSAYALVTPSTSAPALPCSANPLEARQADSCEEEEVCTIVGDRIALYYFPQPSSSRNLCANTMSNYDRNTVSVFSQPHRSTVIEGYTFWSDSAYISYETASAIRQCGSTSVRVGGDYPGSLIALPSADIATLCDFQILTASAVPTTVGASAYPLNFADLNGPVPASAYQCLPICQGECTEIQQASFTPLLAVPSQVRALDSEWARCGNQWRGANDPVTTVGSSVFLVDPQGSSTPIGSPALQTLAPNTTFPTLTTPVAETTNNLSTEYDLSSLQATTVTAISGSPLSTPIVTFITPSLMSMVQASASSAIPEISGVATNPGELPNNLNSILVQIATLIGNGTATATGAANGTQPAYSNVALPQHGAPPDWAYAAPGIFWALMAWVGVW